MTSAIDATKPVAGSPTTQSVRDNFATAKAEITALQAAGPYLPTAGGTINGSPGSLVIGTPPGSSPSRGALVANMNTAAPPTATAGAVVQVVGADAAAATVEIDSFGVNAPANLTLRHAGGTSGTPTQTPGGAAIANIGVSGYGATGWASGYRASYQFLSTELWTDTAQGTRITVSTTPSGTITPLQQVQVGQGMQLGVTGTDLGRGSLIVNMNATAPPPAAGGSVAQFVGPDSSALALSMHSFGGSCGVYSWRANGTNAAPTALLAGQGIGNYQVYGRGATGWSGSFRGLFGFNTTENWTDTAQGCSFQINTTPTGTVATETPATFTRGLTLGTALANGADNGRGSLILNANAAVVQPAAAPAPVLQMSGVDGSNNVHMMDAYGSSAGLTNMMSFRHARGTAAAPTALASSDVMAQLNFYGHDGNASYAGIGAAAAINITALGAFTTGSHQSGFFFYTCPAASTALTQVMLLGAGMQLGAPTGGDKGAGTLNATGVYANNVLLTSDASLKRDIEPLPDDCLALVGAIEPKRFKFIEPPPTPSDNPDLAPTPAGPPGWFDKQRWGFIAQDVEHAMQGQRFDGVVDAGADGIRSLDSLALTAVLWKAVRELSDRLAALEASR